MNLSFRTATPKELANALQDARDYTLALFDCFAAAGMDQPANVPYLSTLNPPLWELGHIAWFAEWYILRDADSSDPLTVKRPSLLTKGDAWFDSNRVLHPTRWSLDLPTPGALKTYCKEVLDRVLDKLSRLDPGADADAALYPYRLALAHETMHGEAFAYTLQTLGVSPQAWMPAAAVVDSLPADIRFAGGSIELGSRPDAGFAFDNELHAHTVHVPAFRMDAALVTNAQYSEFIADGGYQNPQFWTQAGRDWLITEGRSAPSYWERDGRRWQCRRFDKLIALPMNEPVRHISLYEAQAYCAWIGRRLPTEAEWEFAAQSGNPAFRWGNLWEWTCSPLAPYPGFEAGPYREYSAPYFGTHQVLRGASFVTPRGFRSVKFRNFYLPQRIDIFSGFRTCEY